MQVVPGHNRRSPAALVPGPAETRGANMLHIPHQLKYLCPLDRTINLINKKSAPVEKSNIISIQRHN